MRRRLIFFGLAVFGFPLAYLGAETLAWLLNVQPLIDWAARLFPDVIKLLLVLWFCAVAFASAKLVWFVTGAIGGPYLRKAVRAAGVTTLVFASIAAGSMVIATWLPIVTLRTSLVAGRLSEPKFTGDPKCNDEFKASSINAIDVGPRLSEQVKEPTTWDAQFMRIGDTCFQAVIGPSRNKDKAVTSSGYYRIDVERRHKASWVVYFERDFDIEQLPPGVIGARVADIVSYNQTTKVVSFNLKSRTYEYRLPEP